MACSCLLPKERQARQITARLPKSPSKEGRQLTVETAPLHLSYYAYEALLFRALMSPATNEARNDPSSNLCRWFGTAVAEFQAFTEFMDEVTSEDLHGFWGRRKSGLHTIQSVATMGRPNVLTYKCRRPVSADPLRKLHHLPLPAAAQVFGHPVGLEPGADLPVFAAQVRQPG